MAKKQDLSGMSESGDLRAISLEETGVPDEYCARPKGIELETILVLRKKGLTLHQIAKVLGCSRMNVRKRLQKVAAEIEATNDFKEVRADILANTQRKLVSSVDDKAIEEASLLQRVTSMGILYDKERLERGKSTSNILYTDILEAKRAKIEELKKLEEGAAEAGIEFYDAEFIEIIEGNGDKEEVRGVRLVPDDGEVEVEIVEG